MSYLDPIRALRILEGLGLAHEEGWSLPDLPDLVYVIAHQARQPKCAKNHPDFLKRALEIEAALVEGKIISPWGEPEKQIKLP